ncbi:zinc finger BED domain-containing protein 5-like [Onthophagus taurus]|uniref:zinc finger BED domain-containing protein 5-like n=1 Tax=Onthophagus taurus TaxID=166361 RepID=UPI0039BE6AF5
MLTQLISKIKNSQFYSLQLDDSKDVADNENLLVFIRYDCEDNICEDFLFCQPIQTHSTGGEIFKCVNNFIETNNIEWTKCIGICTDGARAMSGTVRGLQGLVKDVAPNAAWTHCCIHRAALAAKGMPTDLMKTFDEVVTVVNFIKGRPLNSRIFKVICEEMGSQHKQLLLHSDVRWLSRGKTLSPKHLEGIDNQGDNDNFIEQPIASPEISTQESVYGFHKLHVHQRKGED